MRPYQPRASAAPAGAPRWEARSGAWRRACGSARARQPAALEPGPLQAALQRLALAHRVPDELVSVVADHRQDGALVDADGIAGDPAEGGIDATVAELDIGGGEAAVERVDEAEFRVDELAVARVHLLDGRDHDLGREGQRRQRGGGGDGAVVDGAEAAGAARRVIEVVAEAVVAVELAQLAGAVAGGESPDVGAVFEEALRIRDRIGPLRVDRAARVLEVVDVALAHRRIADAAEVDPDVRILVPEQRREAQVLVAHEAAPGMVIALGPR